MKIVVSQYEITCPHTGETLGYRSELFSTVPPFTRLKDSSALRLIGETNRYDNPTILLGQLKEFSDDIKVVESSSTLSWRSIIRMPFGNPYFWTIKGYKSTIKINGTRPHGSKREAKDEGWDVMLSLSNDDDVEFVGFPAS